jgi:hypothetical protein
MQKTEKLFYEFITGLFYASVFDTQTSSNPIIPGRPARAGQSSMGRQ